MLLSTVFALVPLGAAANSPTDEDPLIYGGTPVEPCGWPTTVSMQGNCTGTLVHPQVVIYAAHCGAGFGTVTFGENINSSLKVPTQYCRTHPSFDNLGEGDDFAFCVLAQPQDDKQIVPILMGCETQILQPGGDVTPGRSRSAGHARIGPVARAQALRWLRVGRVPGGL